MPKTTINTRSLFLLLLLVAGCQHNPLVGRWEAVEIIGDPHTIGLGLEFEPDGRVHYAYLGSDGKCFVSTEKYEVDGDLITLYLDDALWVDKEQFEFDNSYPYDHSLVLVLNDRRYRLAERKEAFDASRRPKEADIRRLQRSSEQQDLADAVIDFDSWQDISVYSSANQRANNVDKKGFIAWLQANPPPTSARTHLAVAIFGKIAFPSEETLDEMESLLRKHGYEAIGFYRASGSMPWKGWDIYRERPVRPPPDDPTAP